MIQLLRTSFFFCVFAFVFSFTANAETLVQDDIAQDTVWTKEMSPIFVQQRSEDISKGYFNVNVINGAELRIEAGVTVVMAPYTSLRVIRGCQKSYGEASCILNDEDEPKYSKIIAEGTEKNPIIFTSQNDYEGKTAKPGDWGIIDIASSENIIKYTHFRYGGAGGFDNFVSFRKDTVFKNNIVEYSSTNGVSFESSEFKGNIIQGNEGKGVVCSLECQLEGNVIRENKKEGLVLKSVKKNEINNNIIMDNKSAGLIIQGGYINDIQGNFIHNNEGYGLEIDQVYNAQMTVNNNVFSFNNGGIYLYNNHKDIQIGNNNFVKNKSFIIDIFSTSEHEKPALENNWYGIDTGPMQNRGEFYVSPYFSELPYTEEEISFSFPKNTLVDNVYRDYLRERKIDTALLQIHLTTDVLIGDESKKGSLALYSLNLENLRPKHVENIMLEIVVANNQEVSECSIFEAVNNESYSDAEICTKEKTSNAILSGRKIQWQGSYTALEAKTLYFVVLSKGALQSTSVPQIYFSYEGKREILNYKKGETTVVHREEKGGKSEVVVKQEQKTVDTSSQSKKIKMLSRAEILKRRKTQKQSTALSIDPETLAERFKNTLNLSQNAEWKKYRLEDRKKAYKIIVEINENKTVPTPSGALITGVMVTDVVNNQLRFLLKADDGKTYTLLNSAKWEDLVTFIRSDDKKKRIAVYGDFYINYYGNATGIMFSDFKLID